MSVTIGANPVANPAYGDGWARRRVRVGQDWQFLDGSEGEHHITSRWEWSLLWRVTGADYTALVAALTAVHGTVFAFADHLSYTDTCKLGDWEDRQAGNDMHEVTATIREVTA